jgi:hypothetical protein
VPNLGGDTVFDAGFDQNCLCERHRGGLGPADGVLRSRVPEGPGRGCSCWWASRPTRAGSAARRSPR